eukprot:Awhi_evm1s5992
MYVYQGTNMKALMRDEIFPIAASDKDFPLFLTYAMQKSEKHPGNMPRARVFAHAVQSISTDEEWEERKIYLFAGLSEDLKNAIITEVGPDFLKGGFVPPKAKAEETSKVKELSKIETPKVEETPKEIERPKPMVFAIMRNGHEVLRGGMIEVGATLENEDPDKALANFVEELNKLTVWEEIHAKMEEGVEGIAQGFFPILDEKCQGVATTEGLFDNHKHLHELKLELDANVENKDLEALKVTWKRFSEQNEAHLKQEEAIMMPKVQGMAKGG